MRILTINHYAGSIYHGMEFRPYYLSREWVKSGHEAVILAASYSHLRGKNPEPPHDFYEEKIDGITYVWVKTPKYSGNGVGRALNMAAFYAKLRMRAKQIAGRYRPESVIASSTYPYDFYAAEKIARASGAHAFFELHDLWPLTQIELYGMKPGNPYIRSLQKAENYAFRNAEKVISILPDADRYMQERGIQNRGYTCIPNGIVVDTESTKTPEYNVKIEEYKAAGKFIVMYVGGFSTANALEDIVRASALVDRDVIILLVGGGMKKAALMELAEESGGKGLVFLDGVPKAQVPALLGQADCLYIGAKKCSLYRYGIGMNKLYDYMLSARPVIYGVEASNDPVGDAGCGITIKPENAGEIAAAIRKLKSMSPEQRAAMGRSGREYVIKNNNYTGLAARYIQALKGE